MRKILPLALFVILLMNSCDIAEQVVKGMGDQTPLTEQEVVRGLKEALRVSADTAVSRLSAVNGYYGDPKIKIPLPPDADGVVKHKNNPLLMAAGVSGMIDQAVLKINRAAEDAAKSATPIFVNAITSMTVQDAFGILNGSDTAATHYFRVKTYSRLKNSFKPKISNSLNKPLIGSVSANTAWSALTNAYNDVAVFTGWARVNTQLDEYVTRKALNGLFRKLADEERQIRKDPAARVTDILERVFGKKNSF